MLYPSIKPDCTEHLLCINHIRYFMAGLLELCCDKNKLGNILWCRFRSLGCGLNVYIFIKITSILVAAGGAGGTFWIAILFEICFAKVTQDKNGSIIGSIMEAHEKQIWSNLKIVIHIFHWEHREEGIHFVNSRSSARSQSRGGFIKLGLWRRGGLEQAWSI